MFKRLIFCLLVGVDVIVTPANTAVGETPRMALVTALIQVESSGNDKAIGDKQLVDKAYGCLQIRQPLCDDVNRRYGKNYRAQDMLGNRKLSIKVCEMYLAIYATEKHLGHKPTDEDMARIWNGGPKGWRSSLTVGYWSKVRKFLK